MLEDLRKKIDEIDRQILKLLSERFSVAHEIGILKKNEQSPLYRPDREQAVYEHLQKINPGNIDIKILKGIYREIMSATILLEGGQSIAYLGPEGSFTNQAALEKFGSSLTLIPCEDFDEVFDKVQKGKANYGVLPIENSTEGIVNATFDGLLKYDLNIYAEKKLLIEHNLISKAKDLSEIKCIMTIKQAHAQCINWISRNLPHATWQETLSTASAVKKVSEIESHEYAAIGSETAAQIYNIPILERNIKDYKRNTTRFIVISKEIAKRSARSRSTIVFTLSDKAGALFETIKPLYEKNINITSIESRPSKSELWSYVFYLDIEGHIEDANVKNCLEEIKNSVMKYRFLGSYPVDDNL